MSYEYKFVSSLATVKLNASIGFHASFVHLFCITSFRIGVCVRTSYSAMDRSEPHDAKTSGSTGLKRTLSTVSTPQLNVSVGSERSAFHSSTALPAVACASLAQWQSTSRNPPPDLEWHTSVASFVGTAAPPEENISPRPAWGMRQTRTVASSPHDTHRLPSCVTEMPRTAPWWPISSRSALREGTSHSRISPSAAPDAATESCVGDLARHITPSLCPSSAPMKGFANTLSNFVAFNALLYSLARCRG